MPDPFEIVDPEHPPVDEDQLAAAYEAARPFGQGHAGGGDWSDTPVGNAGGGEWGYDQGPPQLQIGNAMSFRGPDQPPGDAPSYYADPTSRHQYRQLLQEQHQREQQGIEQENAQNRLVRTQPHEELAAIDQAIGQARLSQPEQIASARYRQALSQIQQAQANGEISQETAGLQRQQVEQSAQGLWQREQAMPGLMRRQQFLEAQHGAAMQASIQSANAQHLAQAAPSQMVGTPGGSTLYLGQPGRPLLIPPAADTGNQSGYAPYGTGGGTGPNGEHLMIDATGREIAIPGHEWGQILPRRGGITLYSPHSTTTGRVFPGGYAPSAETPRMANDGPQAPRSQDWGPQNLGGATGSMFPGEGGAIGEMRRNIAGTHADRAQYQGRLLELNGQHPAPASDARLPLDQQVVRAEARAQARYDQLYHHDIHAEELRLRTELNQWRRGASSGTQGAAPAWFRARLSGDSLQPGSVTTDAGSRPGTDEDMIQMEAARRVLSEHDRTGVMGSRERPIRQQGGQVQGGQPQAGPQAPGQQQAPSPQQTTEMFETVRQRVAQAPEASRGPLLQRVDRNHALWSQYGSLAQMPEAAREEYIDNDVHVRRALAPAPPRRPWWSAFQVH